MTRVGPRSPVTSSAAAADRQPRKRGRPKKGSEKVVHKRRPQLPQDSRSELRQCTSDNLSVARKPKDDTVPISAAELRPKKHRRFKKEASVAERLPQLHSDSDSDLPLLTWRQQKSSRRSADSRKSQKVGSKVTETVSYGYSERPPELTPCLSVSVGQLSGHVDNSHVDILPVLSPYGHKCELFDSRSDERNTDHNQNKVSSLWKFFSDRTSENMARKDSGVASKRDTDFPHSSGSDCVFCHTSASLAGGSAPSMTAGNHDSRVSLGKLSDAEESAAKKVSRIASEHSEAVIAAKSQPQQNLERSEINTCVQRTSSLDSMSRHKPTSLTSEEPTSSAKEPAVITIEGNSTEISKGMRGEEAVQQPLGKSGHMVTFTKLSEMLKKELTMVKQNTNATAESGSREKVAAAQKPKKTQSQEHAVGKAPDLESSDEHASVVVGFQRANLGHMVEVRPVGQKSKQKSRPAARMAQEVALTAKSDLAHGGKVAAESKEKHIISKSQKNTIKRLPDIGKTAKPVSKTLAVRKTEEKISAGSTVDASSEEMAAKHCATAKAKPVGTSQTSHTSSLKRPCAATGRGKIISVKPRTKSSTSSGNASRGTGDVPTRRTDHRTQAPRHGRQLDKSAKKLIPQWRKPPSTQPPLSSREAQGSSGTKVQSSPLTQTVQESYSSSAVIAPDISSGRDFGGSKMGSSSVVPCEPSTPVQQSEMPAKVSVTPSEAKDNRSSSAEIADIFSASSSSSDGKLPRDPRRIPLERSQVQQSQIPVKVGLSGISSGGGSSDLQFRSRRKGSSDVRPHDPRLAKTSSSLGEGEYGHSSASVSSAQEGQGSLSSTVGLPAVSSNRARSASIFQSGYKIPRVGDGRNKGVEGSLLHRDPRIRKHTHHGHRCREGVHKSPRVEIQHRQRRGQSRSSRNGEVRHRPSTASSHLPRPAPAPTAIQKPKPKVLSLAEYKERQKQDMGNAVLLSRESLPGAGRTTEGGLVLGASLAEQLISSYAKHTPGGRSQDPVVDRPSAQDVAADVNDDVMEDLRDLLSNQCPGSEQVRSGSSSDPDQNPMPFACYGDFMTGTKNETTTKADMPKDIIEPEPVSLLSSACSSAMPEAETTAVWGENVSEEPKPDLETPEVVQPEGYVTCQHVVESPDSPSEDEGYGYGSRQSPSEAEDGANNTGAAEMNSEFESFRLLAAAAAGTDGSELINYLLVYIDTLSLSLELKLFTGFCSFSSTTLAVWNSILSMSDH